MLEWGPTSCPPPRGRKTKRLGRKKILGVVIGMLLVIIIAVALVAFYMNTLVEKGVEEVGSRSLGTELALSGADLSFLGGSLTLPGLQIANPEGFKGDQLFTTSRRGSFPMR